MTLVLCCPYCNSRFADSQGPGPRVRCPRCGDSFPRQAAGTEVNDEATAPSPGAGPVPAVEALSSNRKVARLVLAVMAGMAVLGLAFALWSQPFRRANDRRGPRAGTAPLAPLTLRVLTPEELPALGYLPADSAVVAGVHLAELLEEPAGRELWQQLRSGPAGAVLNLLEGRAGLTAEKMDHLVLGLHPAGGQPRLVTVVRTRRPLAAEALARAAKAERMLGKLVYRLPLASVGEGLLYQADRDTLVASLGLLQARPEDLAGIPAKPRRRAEGLPATVRHCLKNKLARQSLVWLAGSVDDLPALQDLARLAGPASGAVGAALPNLKAFCAGLAVQQSVTLDAALQARDEKGVQRLAALLTKQQPQGIMSFKVIPPPPAGEPGYEEGRAWLLLQLRATPQVMAGLLDPLSPERRP